MAYHRRDYSVRHWLVGRSSVDAGEEPLTARTFVIPKPASEPAFSGPFAPGFGVNGQSGLVGLRDLALQWSELNTGPSDLAVAMTRETWLASFAASQTKQLPASSPLDPCSHSIYNRHPPTFP